MIRPTGRPETTTATRRRNDRGLTTLEWLLIVAAVAGLAALAVVLVQNVVDETAEQIGGSNARLTAAQVAAREITDDAANDEITHGDGKQKCDRLVITYGDALDSEDKIIVWQDDGATDKLADTVDETKTQECNILDK